MGKVTAASLQEVLDKTDYLGVFQDKVRLQKKGGKWWGLCPFHAEKTPSFSVDPDRGLFYCFGCQKGGSIIDFLMESEKVTFLEAVTELAERAGVKLQFEGSSQDESANTEKAALYSLYDKLAETFHWILVNSSAASEARAVLVKRKIPKEIVERFRLGYAPADRTWLHRFLRSKSFSDAFLSQTGLFSSRSHDFPLFANRIIFPICDSKGRVIAFGGRLLSGDGPKYINSPDTEIFHKQENLFAFDKAVAGMKEANTALVCEGYMDALSFHAAGIAYAVAPLGTAFTLKQAQLIHRRADRILLCFDSDEAGQRAAEKACCTAAQAGLEASILRMESGKDASEILENFGEEALKKVVKCSISTVDFFALRAQSQFQIETVEGKAKASAFLFPYLDALDSEIKRNATIDAYAREIGINPASLYADYGKAAAKSGKYTLQALQGQIGAKARQTASAEDGSGAARTADLVFVTAVVLHPEFFTLVGKSVKLDDLEDPHARSLYAALENAERSGLKDTASILSCVDDESAKNFVLSKAADGELEQGVDAIVEDGIRNIRIRSLEKARTRLISEIGRVSALGNSQETAEDMSVMELLRQKMQLDAELANLKGEVDE
ncbi:MAG: DNA primase [Rectinema sp.]